MGNFFPSMQLSVLLLATLWAGGTSFPLGFHSPQGSQFLAGFNLISDCSQEKALSSSKRKLDFHAAVKRPGGVEIGYTAQPRGMMLPFHKTYYRY